MRSKVKMWRNDPQGRGGGAWSARITWYEGPYGVRLQLEDVTLSIGVYPETKEEADHIWFTFRQGAPQNGEQIPFVRDMLALLSSKYPHLTPAEEPA
jgi:hypothetical protein